MGYILAIDVGTTAVKAILVDIATNEMRGASADCTLIQERAAWAEQDADGLWQAVCTAVRRCLSQTAVRPGEVAGLVISAPWKHVIPLDGDCRPLRRGIIWMDGRAAVQAKRRDARQYATGIPIPRTAPVRCPARTAPLPPCASGPS